MPSAPRRSLLGVVRAAVGTTAGAVLGARLGGGLFVAAGAVDGGRVTQTRGCAGGRGGGGVGARGLGGGGGVGAPGPGGGWGPRGGPARRRAARAERRRRPARTPAWGAGGPGRRP